jgi:hypothetical protein
MANVYCPLNILHPWGLTIPIDDVVPAHDDGHVVLEESANVESIDVELGGDQAFVEDPLVVVVDDIPLDVDECAVVEESASDVKIDKNAQVEE